MAMEDFRVDVVIGKGPGATAIPLEIPPFTLVGATTRAGLLPGPAARPVRVHRPPRVLRAARARPDRAPLRRPARRRAHRRTAPPRSPPARAAPPGSRTGCCAGCATTRRCAPTASCTREVSRAALELYEVDELGLDRLDLAVLDALCRRFGGGPVGISTLAVAVGEERETVEEVAEPFLVRNGFLARTPRGRVATPAAWQHLGMAVPPPRRRGGATHRSSRTDVRASGTRSRPGSPPRGYTCPSVGLTVVRPSTLPAREVVSCRSSSLVPAHRHRAALLVPAHPAGSRRQKELARMQSSLKAGDEVMLTSGIFGTLRETEDDHAPASRSPTE